MTGIFETCRGGGGGRGGHVFVRLVTVAVFERDGHKGFIRIFRCRFRSIDGRERNRGVNLPVKGRERDVSDWGRGSSWSM